MGVNFPQLFFVFEAKKKPPRITGLTPPFFGGAFFAPLVALSPSCNKSHIQNNRSTQYNAPASLAYFFEKKNRRLKKPIFQKKNGLLYFPTIFIFLQNKTITFFQDRIFSKKKNCFKN